MFGLSVGVLFLSIVFVILVVILGVSLLVAYLLEKGESLKDYLPDFMYDLDR